MSAQVLPFPGARHKRRVMRGVDAPVAPDQTDDFIGKLADALFRAGLRIRQDGDRFVIYERPKAATCCSECKGTGFDEDAVCESCKGTRRDCETHD